MRAAEHVNVATRAQRAAGRNGGTGWLHDVEQLPEVETEQEVVGLSSLLRGELELTTKTQSGAPAVVKIPYPVLALLVTIALSMIGGGYWLVSSMTELKVNIANMSKQQDKIESHLITQKAYIDAETSKVMFMQGLLSRDQQKTVAEFERDHPLPKLPTYQSDQNQ